MLIYRVPAPGIFCAVDDDEFDVRLLYLMEPSCCVVRCGLGDLRDCCVFSGGLGEQ